MVVFLRPAESIKHLAIFKLRAAKFIVNQSLLLNTSRASHRPINSITSSDFEKELIGMQLTKVV